MEQGEGRERDAVAIEDKDKPVGSAERKARVERKRRLSAEISEASHQWIARLKDEWGLRSRGAVIDQLLAQVMTPPPTAEAHPVPVTPLSVALSDEHDRQSPAITTDKATGVAESVLSADDLAVPTPHSPVHPSTGDWPSDRSHQHGEDSLIEGDLEAQDDDQNSEALFNETGALVLVNREGSLEASLECSEAETPRPHRQKRSVGIDLPGFVRRNTAQLRRSLNPPPREPSSHADVLPSLAEPELLQALETASEHWFSLYGQAANEAVVEASMIWLAQDIWTQSDQCEGEAFTWTLAQHLIAPCAPSWQEGPPSLERVIVLAGLLEDPFSASTLSLRIPTLIRRFVHRFRRRRQGASFATLEHTMTLHGALKLLQIPMDSGQRLTLPLIREAYREMAMNHHPDAGGSVEMMRRLNEAYQLLKELYRNRDS